MFAAGSGKGKIHAATSAVPKTSKSGVDLSKVRGMGVFSTDPEVRAAAIAYGDKLDADRAKAEAKLLKAGKIGSAPSAAEVADTRAMVAKSTISASDLYRDKGQNGLAEIAAAHRPKPAVSTKARPPSAPRSRDQEHAAKAEALRLLAGERRNPHDVIMGLDFNRTAQPGDTPPAAELDRLNDGTLRNMAASNPGSPLAKAAQAALDRRSTPTSGDRHPGYDGLDPRELDLILGDNSINTAGMSLEQKRAALAAYDKRIGAARFGGPSQSPAATSTGSRERTEISGWKGGQSPRRAAKTTPEGAGAAEIGAALSSATTRDQGRAALNGLTASQLREVAAANGVTVGSSYSKAKIRDAILQQLVGRRLDSAAIHQMTAPKKSARQIMQTGG